VLAQALFSASALHLVTIATGARVARICCSTPATANPIVARAQTRRQSAVNRSSGLRPMGSPPERSPFIARRGRLQRRSRVRSRRREADDHLHRPAYPASAVMHTYAVDGIRLDLKVDHAPISINVAMPVGLLVNELLTNAFKYAFRERGSGTIIVRCLHEQENHYRVVVADDGDALYNWLNSP
jgi:hypothetical protein